MGLPYEAFLALRFLRYHRGRRFVSIISLISVVGVTVGTAAMVIALALMTGFEKDVRDRIVGGSAHLTVLGTAGLPFEGAEALAERLRGDPEIRSASVVLRSPAMMVNEPIGATAFVELHGVHPDRHADAFSGAGGEMIRQLLPPSRSAREPIVLGEELAARLHVHPGDSVRVLVPRVSLTPFSAMPRSRVVQVVGMFRGEVYTQSLERAFVRIEECRRLLDAADRASWIELRLRDPEALDTVKARVRRAVEPDWIVVDMIEQNQELMKALRTEKLLLFLAVGLIVVVAALNIVSTLILMVTDKVRDIGTLTAMGARPRGIATVFVLQGIAIGVVGAVLGLALGAGTSWWLDRYRVIPLDPEVYYLTHVPFATRPADLVVVGILVFLVSFSATLYPAWRAATLDPIEAIRHE